MLKKILSSAHSNFKKNQSFYVFFLISSFIFLIWLLAFYPAIMTRDSMDSWRQASTNNYSNWHPYIFSFYLKILSSFSNSPAAIVMFQVFISAILSAYAFFKLYQIKDKRVAIVAFVLFTSSIPVGLYNITIWKDIIFSQLVVCWGMITYFFIKNGKKDLNYSSIYLLSFLLFFTSTVRYNGIIFLLIIPSLFYLGKILDLKKSLFFLLTTLTIFFSINSIFQKVFAIENTKQLLNLSYKIHLDAAILKSDNYSYGNNKAEFPLSELYKLIPLENLTKDYQCFNSNSILFSKDMHQELLKDETYYNKVDYISNRLISNNIALSLADRLCIFKSTLLSEGTLYYNALDSETSEDNDQALNISQNSKLPAIHSWLKHFISTSKTFPLNLLFWNLTFPLLLFSFSLYKGYRKDQALFYYSLILTIQLPILFLTITANEFRYFYFLYLGSFFLLPMLTKDSSLNSKVKDK